LHIDSITHYIIGERVKRVRHFQGCTNSKSYAYIHVYMYMCVYIDIREV